MTEMWVVFFFLGQGGDTETEWCKSYVYSVLFALKGCTCNLKPLEKTDLKKKKKSTACKAQCFCEHLFFNVRSREQEFMIWSEYTIQSP